MNESMPKTKDHRKKRIGVINPYKKDPAKVRQVEKDLWLPC